MKQNAFRRILALILSLSFLVGGGAISVSADEDLGNGSSVSDTSLSDVRELLSADSYSEYCEKEISLIPIANMDYLLLQKFFNSRKQNQAL